MTMTSNTIPANGLLAVVKEDCPTCQLVVPVLSELMGRGTALNIISQDELTFLDTVGAPKSLDATLEHSYRLNIETVPTLIKMDAGSETARIVGWHREAWETFTDQSGLGSDLPAWRPGCGAKNVEPAIKDQLDLAFGTVQMASRIISISDEEDAIEACYERGWSDGMPLVPPTKLRVYRMLQGTGRGSDFDGLSRRAEIIAHTPHNLAPVSVEKVAINAVMAGCKPEYMPVVLAAVEAVCDPNYGLTGVMSSTWSSSPVIVVTGPIAKRIGMNSGFSALGSGNRANATIGRAVNLVIRNIGEVRPGEVARSTFGSPGRYTFCFAENEDDTAWLPISTKFGIPKGQSAVTLLSGDGLQMLADQTSRTPESLSVSFAEALKPIVHPKLPVKADVILAVAPEHSRVFEQAGWSKARLCEELEAHLQLDTARLVKGYGGCAEGLDPETVAKHPTLPKFAKDGIHVIRVGSNAGLFSAIIGCWPNRGATGTTPVVKAISN